MIDFMELNKTFEEQKNNDQVKADSTPRPPVKTARSKRKAVKKTRKNKKPNNDELGILPI